MLLSFSSDVKSELLKISNISSCCFHAQVYGLVLFAHFTSSNISITTENKSVFDFYKNVLKDNYGCSVKTYTNGKRKITAAIEDEKSIKSLFSEFGHNPDETTRINYANFQNECCISSFLRGVFLSCGFITNPEKGYHLEMVVPYKKLSSDLIRVINELDLNPKYIMRKGNHIVYFKDSEDIEDFLTYIGAQNSVLIIMNKKIEKDIKNKVNRKLNFEMHNLTKTVSAATAQVESITYIKKTAGLASLPDNLRSVAEARLKYPEASLNELLLFIDDNISKSGLKHRLDKIIEFSDCLKEKAEE